MEGMDPVMPALIAAAVVDATSCDDGYVRASIDVDVYKRQDLIYRAIANLLLNSRNHNPGGCQICVRVEYADGGVSDAGYAISIEDNGTGITSNELDRLYHASYLSLIHI